MSKNRNTRNELLKMSREKLVKQIEFYQRDLGIASARALKYYNGYKALEDHFDSLPDDLKKDLDAKLKLLKL